MEKVALKKVENEYKKSIVKNFGNGQITNVDEMISISLSLFKEIKAKGIINDDEGDMLLFQYGTRDWGGGKFFEFNITRQFIKQNDDEPYQLSMTLFFEPAQRKSCNCWSGDFDNLKQWVESIKETEGYRLGKSLQSKKFEIRFEQC